MQWITNFKLPRLEYPVTTVYPWRHFNLIAFTISIIVLVFLTFVNVPAVGYESYSELDVYHPPAQRPSWSPFLQQSTSICDPHQILQGDTFKTNISAFDYLVEYINTTQVDPHSAGHSGLNGIAYADDPLATACDQHYRTLKVMVDNVRETVTGSVVFNCSFATSVMVVTASYTASHSVTDDDPFGIPLVEAPGIKRALQVLGLDVAQAALAESQTWLSASGYISCPGDEFRNLTPAALDECYNRPAQLEVYAVSGPSGHSSGSVMDSSIHNYLQALSAASLADTGTWLNNSIFVSPEIVNATLLLPGLANLLEDKPSSLNVTPTPAIISITYTCRAWRHKPLLNFVISVLVADLSLFATFWAIFSFVASTLAKSKASPNHRDDVETRGAAPAQDYTAQTFPMIHRSPSTEYIEMGDTALASDHTLETLPMTHRGSTEALMGGEREDKS